MTALVFIVGAASGIAAHSLWLRRLRRQVEWKLDEALTQASCSGVILADGTYVTSREYGLAIGNESDVTWQR